jgi:hypothetical protein
VGGSLSAACIQVLWHLAGDRGPYLVADIFAGDDINTNNNR